MNATINAGYPKNGTTESRAHWDVVRGALPRFEYTPPDTVLIIVPREFADDVNRLINKLMAGKAT